MASFYLRRILAFSFLVFCSMPVFAQSISASAISPATYCAGNTVLVPYTITGTYTSGNIFTAQLSNATGSFATPIDIGSLTSTTLGTITGTIPANTVQGAGYRIRVVSTQPVRNNTSATVLTINALPSITTQPIDKTTCTGGTTSFSVVASGAGLTYQWYENGLPLSNGGIYSGVTTSTLTLTGATVSNSYYVTVSGTCTPSVTSSTVNLTVYASAPGNPATFGNDVWNVYAYNTIGFTGYSGYYIEPLLSFNTATRWASTTPPSNSSGYQGCAIPATNISLSMKRTGFTAGTYSVNLFSLDDGITVLIDGVQVYTRGCCVSSVQPAFFIGNLTASSLVEIRWTQGTGGSGLGVTFTPITTPVNTVLPGTIQGDQSVCSGQTPSQALSTLVAATATGCTLNNYQWQISTDSVIWNDIVGATAASYTITSGITQNTWYKRSASNYCGAVSIFSNPVKITVFPSAPGNPTVYGNNVWNCYLYNAINFTNYSGYYTEPLLSFSTTNRWASTLPPSNASGYQGCVTSGSNVSMSMKRTGFTPGTYTINMTGLDDGITVLVDGVQVFTAGCCISAAQPAFWTGDLTATSLVELRWTQGGGGSYLGVTFTPITTPVNTVLAGTIKINQSVCTGQTPTQVLASLSVGSATGCNFKGYQWQSSTDSLVWTDIASATALNYTIPGPLTQTTWYRRAASNFCGTFDYSIPVKATVYATAPGDPTVFGSNVWNAYVYDFNSTGYTNTDNNWTDYKGVYTTPGISTANQGFSTPTIYAIANTPSSAPDYQGCLVGSSLSGAQIKRIGFPDSTYQIDFTSDDAGYLYVNGLLVYSSTVATTASNVWTGTLDATSSIDFHYKNNGSTGGGTLTIAPITPTVSLYGGLISLSGPDTICAGNIPSPFVATDPAVSSCYLTYQWESSDTLGFISIAGATGANYTPTAALGITTLFRRKVTDACGQISYTNIVTVTVGPASPPDPSVFGTNTWIAYVYNAQNFNPAFLFGSYEDPGASTTDPSFDSRSQWGTTSTPSLAPSYIGCQVGVDNHSVSYKRRGFPAGTYSISEINDDACSMFVNGVLVYSRSTWTPTYIIGVGAVYLDATSTVEFRWTEGVGGSFGGLTFLLVPTPAPIVPGVIANTSTTVCPGNTPNAFTSTTDATSGCFITYKWQQNTGSGFTDIANTNSATFTPTTPITVPTSYRRFVTDGCSRIDSSNVVTIGIATPAAPDTTFSANSLNVWHVYAYSNITFTTLSGKYVDNGFSVSNPSFDSRNSWGTGSTPSAAAGYVGCQVPVDQHGVVYKRKGFVPGTYQLDFLTDDAGSVYVNGVLVYTSVGCCVVYPNIWKGDLNASSTIEFRWVDSGGGGSYGNLTMTTVTKPTSILGGVIATSTPIVCSGNTPAPFTSTSNASGGCFPSYQWESKTTGAYSNIVGAVAATYTPTSITATTTYRRKVTDACGNSGVSNDVTITVGSPAAPDTSAYGANVWRAYVYNSNNFGAVNLSGVYTDNGVSVSDPSFDTRSLWAVNSAPSLAPGYSGCQVGGNNHSVIYKRVGFPTGTYTINAGADNFWYLYINGILINSCTSGGCTTSGTLWTGTLTSTSKIEYRLVETTGNSYGFLNVVNSTPVVLTPGTISGDQTICSSTIPTTFTSSVDAISSCVITYQWQRATASTTGPWTNVGGNSKNLTSAVLTSNGGVATNYYFIRRATDCSKTDSSNVITVVVNPTPSAAGAITGALAVCSSQTGVTYSIPAVANATGYNWTVPTGATITSGANTNSIVVTFGTTSGIVRVQPVNSCGLGLYTTINVAVTPAAPGAAGAMTGVTTVCAGQFSVPYSIAAVANATSYTWVLPAGATQTSGGTSNSIMVTFGATAGNITVAPTNGCGSGAIASKTISINPLPNAAGVITGAGSVCPFQTGVTYTVPAVTNATSYSWSLPFGSTITAGLNTRTITVSFGAIAGNITVTPINACGNGSTSTKIVSVKSLPNTPSAITGPLSVCQGNVNKIYSIPAVLFATSYVWTVPTGATITSGAGTNTIRVTFGTTSGDVTVTPSNSCGNGATSTLPVTVYLTPPADAGAITGLNNVCANDIAVPYSIPPALDATNYTVTFKPAGSVVTSGTGTNAITLTMGTASGNLTIRPSNACGSSTPSTLAITVNPPPTAVAGSDISVCSTVSSINIHTGSSSTNNNGVTWTSSGTGTITNPNSLTTATYAPSAADLVAGSVTITLTATGKGTCSNVVSSKVITFHDPISQTVSGATAICVGVTTPYTATTAGGTWSSGSTSVATVNSSTGDVTGVSAGTSIITYSVTTIGGCVNTANQTITISSPIAQTISGLAALCEGGTTTYSSTTAGGTWSSATPSVATIDAVTGDIVAIAAGTSVISYSVTTAGGCINTATKTITISAPIFQTITGASNLCIGLTSTYSSTTPGGTWSSATPSNATVNPSTGLVTGVAAGSSLISYTVTSAGGCINTASQTVFIQAPITQTITGSTALCVGNTANYSSTTTGGTWTSATPSVATVNSSSGLVSGISAGTSVISYSVVTLGGCTTGANQTITVSAPVTQTITGATNLCVGLTTTFTSTTTGGTWTSLTPSRATVDPVTGVVTGVSSGAVVISYSVTTTGGCINSSSTSITIRNPIAQTITGATTLCVGSTTTYSATTAGGTWTSATPSVATINPTTGVVTALSSGTSLITYSVTSLGGCVNTASQTITISAPITQTITGVTALCVDSTTTYTSTTGGGTWTSGSPSVVTINPSTGFITALSAGSSLISYSVTTAGGCVNTASKTITTSVCNFVWTGASTTEWHVGANWNTLVVPNSTNSVTIPSSVVSNNMPTVSTTVNVKSIDNAGVLTLASTGVLNAFGDIVNTGTVTAAAGSKLTFKGSVAQTITGVTALSKVEVNNTSGVSILSQLTINGTLSLSNGALTTNNFLTINFDNGGNIGYVATDNGSIVGNVKGRRDVVAKTHYIAAPFSGSTSLQVAQTTPLWVSPYWKMNTRVFATQNWSAVINNTTPMPLGTGFSLSLPAAAPLVLTGTYNHNYTLTGPAYSNAAAGKFILVGNPYPSTLDWDNASGWTKSNISAAIYYWDGPNQRTASYVSGVGTNGGTQFIPAMQSFLVATTGTGGLSSSVSINNDARSTSNQSYWRTTSVDEQLVGLSIKSSTGMVDETVVRFDELSSNLFDTDVDAYKVMNSIIPSLYTKTTASSTEYSINTLPMVGSSTMIPLNLKVPADGVYELNCSKYSVLGYNLLLEDKLTGVFTPINESTALPINAKRTDSTNRFVLRFAESITTRTNSPQSTNIQIATFDNSLVLSVDGIVADGVTIEVYSADGNKVQVLTNQSIASGVKIIPMNSTLSSGVYLVKFNIGGDYYAGKVVIQ